MISTRLHGLIDYATASIEGGLSTSGWLTPSVRRILGTAAIGHAGNAAMTDYEAGLQAKLTMRQHLALDAAGGAALLAAGLLMRRQPSGSRALLAGLGLSQLAVVAYSSSRPGHGPGEAADWFEPAGYPPLDTIKPVAEGVSIVDSLLPGGLGSLLPVRMTVIRLPDGDLLLHSPTRFSHDLRNRLEAIGRIRHLVAPNIAHWTFLEDWQAACPGATTWAAPGLRDRRQVRQSRVRLDHDLGDAAPAEWGGDLTLVTVPGGLDFHECALFHQPTRTLVLTDLVLNLEARKLPVLVLPLARLLGVVAPGGMPPVYLRAVIRLRRDEAARAAARLLALQPERVIFAHGRWFRQNGTVELRRSLRWLVKQGR